MMYNNPQDIRDEIAELKQKLETTTPTDNEEFYGRIHHSLGRLLTQLAVFEKPVGHLEEALKHYNIAETFITVIEEPIHYPNMLNDKGLVYLELARQRNMQENLRRAEAIFKDVLTFWKPKHTHENMQVFIST